MSRHRGHLYRGRTEAIEGRISTKLRELQELMYHKLVKAELHDLRGMTAAALKKDKRSRYKANKLKQQVDRLIPYVKRLQEEINLLREHYEAHKKIEEGVVEKHMILTDLELHNSIAERLRNARLALEKYYDR